jgi:hypothetical protein
VNLGSRFAVIRECHQFSIYKLFSSILFLLGIPVTEPRRPGQKIIQTQPVSPKPNIQRTEHREMKIPQDYMELG